LLRAEQACQRVRTGFVRRSSRSAASVAAKLLPGRRYFRAEMEIVPALLWVDDICRLFDLIKALKKC
jgi:hypothetical protein